MALCAHLGLDPVADPSNDDPRFVRNRVRHELLPLCSAIAGRDVVPVLARQAGVLAGDADLLDAVASLVDPEDAAALAAAPEAVARRSVRGWLAGEGPYPPPLDAVDRVLEVARKAPAGHRGAGRPEGASPAHGRPLGHAADCRVPEAAESRRSGTVAPVTADGRGGRPPGTGPVPPPRGCSSTSGG